MRGKSQSGNVLFLILIAVALFAALSYVVTSSTRSGSGSTERENVKLEASRMLGYAVSIRAAVQQMIIRGVPAEGIRLHPAGAPYDACSTELNCIFNPQYGGAVADNNFVLDPAVDLNGAKWDYFETADTQLIQIATAAPDLYMRRDMQQTSASLKLCEELNNGLGLPKPPIDINNLPANFSSGCVDTSGGQYWFVFSLTEK